MAGGDFDNDWPGPHAVAYWRRELAALVDYWTAPERLMPEETSSTGSNASWTRSSRTSECSAELRGGGIPLPSARRRAAGMSAWPHIRAFKKVWEAPVCAVNHDLIRVGFQPPAQVER